MDPNEQKYIEQFDRLNVNAAAFVPNASAQPFVPYGYNPQGYGPPPGAMYGMGPPPPMHGYMGQPYPGLPGMYHHHQFPQHRGVYMGGGPPSGYHGQQNVSNIGPPSDFHNYQMQPAPQASRQPLGMQPQSISVQQQEPVDSWEDIADSGPSDSRQEDKEPPADSGEGTAEEMSQASEQPQAVVPAAEDKMDTLSKEDGAELKEESVTSTAKLAEPRQPKSGRSEQRDKKDTSRLQQAESAKVKVVTQLPTCDDKENLNIIFIGHVDAGKSTIGGQLMFLTGQVDKRTLEKFEREARAKNRETWYLSWALDLNPEEREKGKTVEVGRAYFETEKKRFHILDAPGHAGFVPNMIGGAAQADVAVLVISARKGEFETGFEKGGQTREHTVLVKTAGAKHLVVLINKMDDPTVAWSPDRYEECRVKLLPFLKRVGFKEKDVHFMPVSGYNGTNLKEIDRTCCPFYDGLSFLHYLDTLSPIAREDSGPVRLPLLDKFKDMGTFVIGKLESGSIYKGQSLVLMPNRVQVEVLSVHRNEQEIQKGFCGDNLKVKLKGIEEEEISSGFILCDPDNYCHVGRVFDAQITILESKSIICAGYNAVMHLNTLVEEVQIRVLVAVIDKKTGKRIQTRPRFVKQDQGVIVRLEATGVICMESFKDFPQLARFTLRDEGVTVAVGKILKIIE